MPELQEAVALAGGRSACAAAHDHQYRGVTRVRWLSDARGRSFALERPRTSRGWCPAANGGGSCPRVGCSGVAATFNAPLNGVLRAEIVIGAWGAETFAPVVVSAVISHHRQARLRRVPPSSRTPSPFL